MPGSIGDGVGDGVGVGVGLGVGVSGGVALELAVGAALGLAAGLPPLPQAHNVAAAVNTAQRAAFTGAVSTFSQSRYRR